MPEFQKVDFSPCFGNADQNGPDLHVRITADGHVFVNDLACILVRNDGDGTDLESLQRIHGRARRRICDLKNRDPFWKDKFFEKDLKVVGHHAQTALLKFQDALLLIAELAGRARSRFTEVMLRYHAGDGRLAEEVVANGRSAALLNQEARRALGLPPPADGGIAALAAPPAAAAAGGAAGADGLPVSAGVGPRPPAPASGRP